jgi:hypothetical protein
VSLLIVLREETNTSINLAPAKAMDTDTEKSCETTDVIVIGCGPTGALLTALLGGFAVPNVVLEKEALITEDPRGIALDEDGIRLLQAVGLYDKIYTEIGSCEYSILDPSCRERSQGPRSDQHYHRRLWTCQFHSNQEGFAYEAVYEVQFQYCR